MQLREINAQAQGQGQGPSGPSAQSHFDFAILNFFVSLRTLIASYIIKYFGIFGTERKWSLMMMNVIMYFLLHIHLRLRPLQSRQSRNRCHLCRSRSPRPWMGRTCEVSETDYIASTPKDLVRAPSESGSVPFPSFLPSLPAPPHPLGVL